MAYTCSQQPYRQLIVWTPENVDTLKELVSAGHSARIIGERMGTTRSSVLGKAQRLGLSLAKEHSFNWTKENIERLKEMSAAGLTRFEMSYELRCSLSSVSYQIRRLKWRYSSAKVVVKPTAPSPKAEPWEPKKPVLEPPITTPVDIVAVTGCRFPVTDDTPFLFCDAPKFKTGSYCSYHQYIAEL